LAGNGEVLVDISLQFEDMDTFQQITELHFDIIVERTEFR